MPGKISILKENGETLNSNIVSIFTMPETEKKYIITTENAVDPHGLTVLHVSELVDDTLARIATAEEWDAIKNIMRVIISGNVGSYTYLPVIANARTNGQYSRDISVSDVAAKQLTDAYFANQSSQGGAQPTPVGVPAQNPISANNGVVSAVPPVQNPGVQENVAANPSAPMAPMAQAAVPQGPATMQPSSIFPESSNVSTEDNELIPGIAEIGADQNVNSMSKPVLSPAESALPVNPGPSAQLTAAVEPVMPISITPVMDNTALAQQPQQVGGVAPALQQTGNISSVVAPVAQPSAGPSPVQPVPQAQIVQPAAVVPDVPSVTVNFNSAPSFAPNATLDEVVSGSQELFMESVKNLVQTMTEKIYRDLYEKEALLKEREKVINDREMMVNSQMMTMMNNFNNVAPTIATPTTVSPAQDVNGMAQPMQPVGMNINPMQGVAPQQNPQTMMPMSPLVNNAVISPIAQDNN